MSQDILTKIVAFKREEIARKKRKLSLDDLKIKLREIDPPRDFKKSVFGGKGVSIIAEIKRFSPSGGIIKRNLDPSKLAKLYQENGASAISVLLDGRFFGGSLEDLKRAREATSLPILAKEFILDEYQLYEVRWGGADAVLLIVKILEEEKLLRFCRVAQDLNLACLVEVHSPQEVRKLSSLPPWIIVGINNRNLKNFQVDLSITRQILNLLPRGKLVISESGIRDVREIRKLKEAGVSAFLVGEAILRSKDPAKKLRELSRG